MKPFLVFLLIAISTVDCKQRGSKLINSGNVVHNDIKSKNKTLKVDNSTVDVEPEKRKSLSSIVLPLRIASWNIQRLGQTKMSKSEVVQILVKVMRRYDIIVVMEVVDIDGLAPKQLLQALNQGVSDQRDLFSLTISERLGRSSYKEQYAFYHKPSRASVIDTYQYNDTVNDAFQFEPFVVVFKSTLEGLSTFAVAPIHTKPDDAVKEINALPDVYDKFVKDKGIEDMIIMGDYNAGCTYVTDHEWATIKLFTDKRFHWMITDHMDTTTKGTSCAYDRIVVAGNSLLNAVYEHTAQPYYFDQTYNITNSSLLEDVSDHYPVEVMIRGSVPSEMASVMEGKVEVAVTVSGAVSASAMTAMLVSQQEIHACDSTTAAPPDQCLDKQQLLLLEWSSNGMDEAIQSLEKYALDYPEVLSCQVLEVLKYKLGQEVLTDASIHGEDMPAEELAVEVLCRPPQSRCSFSVKSKTVIN